VEEPAHDPAEGGVAQRRAEGHPEAIRLRVGDGNGRHRLGRRRRGPHCRCNRKRNWVMFSIWIKRHLELFIIGKTY
jgi:hypothetical protein